MAKTTSMTTISYPAAVIAALRAFDNARAAANVIHAELSAYRCERAADQARCYMTGADVAEWCEPCRKRDPIWHSYAAADAAAKAARRKLLNRLTANRKPRRWPKQQRAVFARETYDRVIGPLRHTARQLGWAVAVHGSLARDIDLVFVPWHHTAAAPYDVAVAVAFCVDGYIDAEELGDLRKPLRVPVQGRGATIRIVNRDDSTVSTWLDCLFVAKDEKIAAEKRRFDRRYRKTVGSDGGSA